MKSLNESKTFKRYEAQTGMCLACYEHTSVLIPCCNALVDFEGGEVHPDDVISDIAHDLSISKEDAIDLVEGGL